jgi:hypothetical protein
MKLIIKYGLLVILLTQVFGCIKYDPGCPDVKPNFFHLDSNNLKQNPYHTKKIDSLVYISNKSDTLILVCTFRNENQWIGSDFTYISPDCGGKTTNTYHQAKYIVYDKSINSISRFFRVNHSKQGFTGFDENENKNLVNTIWFGFDNLNFFIHDFEISNPSNITYSSKLTFNNREFTDLIWKYPSDSTLGKGYFNIELGLVHIVDNRNSTEWTLHYAK